MIEGERYSARKIEEGRGKGRRPDSHRRGKCGVYDTSFHILRILFIYKLILDYLRPFDFELFATYNQTQIYGHLFNSPTYYMRDGAKYFRTFYFFGYDVGFNVCRIDFLRKFTL
jgi:hypothetical protein